MTTMVTVRHMRQAQLCASGGREWAKRQGLDWSTFVREGYPVEVFEAIDDHYAQLVAQAARAEAAAEGGDDGRR